MPLSSMTILQISAFTRILTLLRLKFTYIAPVLSIVTTYAYLFNGFITV